MPTPQPNIQVFETTGVEVLSTTSENSWNYFWKKVFHKQIVAP